MLRPFFGILGLYLGLCFPNLSWRSEAEVVKQGAPLLITMFGGMLLAVGGASLAAVLGSGKLICALLALVLLLGAALLWRVLVRDGARRLEKLI